MKESYNRGLTMCACSSCEEYKDQKLHYVKRTSNGKHSAMIYISRALSCAFSHCQMRIIYHDRLACNVHVIQGCGSNRLLSHPAAEATPPGIAAGVN